MRSEFREQLRRLARLVRHRDLCVSAAEGRVQQAAAAVQQLQVQRDETLGRIRATRQELALRGSATGLSLQVTERFVDSLTRRCAELEQSIQKAAVTLNQRRLEWVEARREQRIVTRLQEHRVHLAAREEAVQAQKSADELFNAKHARTRISIVHTRRPAPRISS